MKSTKQRTDTTTTVFTKTAGRKRVETESQDSHPVIGIEVGKANPSVNSR